MSYDTLSYFLLLLISARKKQCWIRKMFPNNILFGGQKLQFQVTSFVIYDTLSLGYDNLNFLRISNDGNTFSRNFCNRLSSITASYSGKLGSSTVPLHDSPKRLDVNYWHVLNPALALQLRQSSRQKMCVQINGSLSSAFLWLEQAGF
jgi:hypothetical protein